MNSLIDKSAHTANVRAGAVLFYMLSENKRNTVNMAILDGESLAYYRGGYNSAAFAEALAIGLGTGSKHLEYVRHLAWAYAAKIVELTDAAGPAGSNAKTSQKK
jgi:hypothetical protein